MCDSLKPSDEKYSYSQNLMKSQGCIEENRNLQKCLDSCNKNWSKCQEETKELQECFKKARIK